ncbi:NAD(P)-binding protein [Schizopora paradoxa]|uniref:NAD(P)-binding protein n=1 Tax=Schizopora paradoxa TaxID=27342 RepID=A0A0H2RSC5_9AGAM|nr:NAD(P)-binding protein [Schizopora paradoxa]
MPSYAITGTSRGIGLTFVKTLSENPANTVFALARNAASAKNLNEFVASHKHKNAHVVESDNDNIESIQNAAETVGKITGGKLDVLINNSARMFHERNELTLDAYEDPHLLDHDMLSFFKTNVLGVIHTTNAFLPLIRAGEMKKCIIITSTLGSPRFTVDTKFIRAPGYSMSKAASNLAVAKYAAQYKEEGIVFLSISPGLVRTKSGSKEEVDAFYDLQEKQIRSMYPKFEGAITPEQSVRDQLDLIHRVSIEQTGSFVNRDGTDAEAEI